MMNKLYAIGRKDLPPGLRAAQLSHACIEWTATFGRPPENLVLLEVENEEELNRVWAAMQILDAPYVAFHEPDLDDALTAVAVFHADAPRLLSSIPLALKAA
jgi:hypothetical protein